MKRMKKQTLARKVYASILWFAILLSFIWGIGIIGFMTILNDNFINALYNSAMTFTGLGMSDTVTTTSGKIFLSIYAIFCNFVYFNLIVIAVSPFVHYAMSVVTESLPIEEEK